MDKEEKRTDIAVEAVKQQITISAAVIAFVATLAGSDTALRNNIEWVIVPFLISICSGVFALLSISWGLYSDDDTFSLGMVRLFGTLQAMVFIIGLVAVWRLA